MREREAVIPSIRIMPAHFNTEKSKPICSLDVASRALRVYNACAFSEPPEMDLILVWN